MEFVHILSNDQIWESIYPGGEPATSEHRVDEGCNFLSAANAFFTEIAINGTVWDAAPGRIERCYLELMLSAMREKGFPWEAKDCELMTGQPSHWDAAVLLNNKTKMAFAMEEENEKWELWHVRYPSPFPGMKYAIAKPLFKYQQVEMNMDGETQFFYDWCA